MPDLEELCTLQQVEIHTLQQEVTSLRTQMQALEGKHTQAQALSALLLQTACGYRDAHAAMQQDVRMLSTDNPLTDFGRDQASVKVRAWALRSAQAVLFDAIEVVEEAAERTAQEKKSRT